MKRKAKAKTKVVIIKEGRHAQSWLKGTCDYCNKEHTISIPDIQATKAIISTFMLKQESKENIKNGIKYTYS